MMRKIVLIAAATVALALPDGVLHGVRGQVGVQRAGDPPADDVPGVE